MSKIIRFEANNLMRLQAVEITPSGHMVVIGGKNAQGKTSVLNAIAMALGGKNEVPERPIREGQSNGHVIVETPEFTVIRRFSASGGSSLEVRNAEGQKLASPQGILDKFVSKVSFDPLAFTRMKPDQQAETVRKMAGIDFSAQDARYKEVYEERTALNRQVKDKEVSVRQMERFPDAPEAEVSSAELATELEKANAANKARETKQEELSNLCDGIEADEESSLRIERQIKELTEQKATIDGRVKTATATRDALRSEVEAMPVTETDPILQRMREADVINAKVRANLKQKEASRELIKLQTQAGNLTAELEEIDEEKEIILSKAKFPIEGLSFNSSGVLFNNIPFEQSSGAEQLRVSLAIACALNPKLPVMLIRDGSLLDEDSMKLLAEHAEKHGAQVWLEVVGNREDATVLIEDGSVVEKPAK
jgi:DNA repair exonuclease SbcCD ATPase subunit